MDQAFMHVLRSQMTVLIVFAGIIVTLLSACIAFVVAWNLRQDKKITTLSETVATVSAKLSALQSTVDHSVPELYQKWDQLIQGHGQDTTAIVNAVMAKVDKRIGEKDKS